MNLYSPKGNLDTSDYFYYNEGNCARVYKKGSVLLKSYKSDCKFYNIITPKVFDYIKDIDLPHVLKLGEYYYYYKTIWNFLIGIDAYTMQYAGERIPSLLKAPTEYLLDMVSDLEKTIVLLSKKRIILNDTHHGNIIFGKNDVTIIDPDQFVLSSWRSQKYILEKNKAALVDYVLSTMIYDVKKPLGREYIYELIRLYYMDTKCIAKSFKEYFNEDTPYLTLKKNLH